MSEVEAPIEIVVDSEHSVADEVVGARRELALHRQRIDALKPGDEKPAMNAEAKLGQEISKADQKAEAVCDTYWQRPNGSKKGEKAYVELKSELSTTDIGGVDVVRVARAAKFVEQTVGSRRSWEDAAGVLEANPDSSALVVKTVTENMAAQTIHQGPLELRGGADRVLGLLVNSVDLPDGPDNDKLWGWQAHLDGASAFDDFQDTHEMLLGQTRQGVMGLAEANDKRQTKAQELVASVTGASEVKTSDGDMTPANLGLMLATASRSEAVVADSKLASRAQGAVVGYTEVFLQGGGDAESAAKILQAMVGEKYSVWEATEGKTDMGNEPKKQLTRVVKGNWALENATLKLHRDILNQRV